MGPSPLVVLSGPPGAGKTTVAALVAGSVPLGVHLRGDEFWRSIASGRVSPYRDGSQRQNEIVMSALGAAAARYARGGYLTVLDVVAGPWLLAEVTADARAQGVPVAYVVLRPSSDVTLARAVARPNAELRAPGPIRQMYGAFRDLGAFERYVVDTSAQSPRDTASDVLRRVETGVAMLDYALLSRS